DAVSTAPVYQEDSRQSVTDPSTATVNADLAQTATAANQTLAAATTSGSATGLTGTLVFQSSPGGLLYAYRLDTGALWSLTNGFDPAISPDGQTVAFVREGGENGIYLIDIDGGNERLIFSGRTRLSSPKWSPDGQWILFTRSDEYSECVDLGRGGCVDVNRLPPGMPTDNLTLSKEYEYNLAVVDPDGDHYHDIAALESARVADWSKAGIVYQSSAGLQITDDREDAENRLLLFIPLQPPHEDPDWQPNGGKVAFVQHHGSHYEIFTINPDGSSMTALTRPVTTLVDEMPNNLAPAWSPDGHHIVFLSNRAAGNEAGAWRIWVMDADGSNQRALPITITIHYTYGNEQSVDWGPTS
ncbi:MAG: PD40 domain-containing protein, partial [Caldilineaceae bacterium]|nr:PD40 domain-containing protein [Caldilineaceae bacterium]